MKTVPEIWKAFNEEQDKKEEFASAERGALLKDFTLEVLEDCRGFGASYMYETLKLGYETKDLLVKEKHGIVARTLENALTWFNDKTL